MSKEGMLFVTAFELESPGIVDSGYVRVSGQQAYEGISRLEVEAFGHRFELTPQQLEALKDFRVNGVQLTYEHGYEETGGRTVYVVLSRGFTSGHVACRYVFFTESGRVGVQDGP